MKSKSIYVKGLTYENDIPKKKEFNVILTSDEIGKSMSIRLGNGEMISLPMDYIYKLFKKEEN